MSSPFARIVGTSNLLGRSLESTPVGAPTCDPPSAMSIGTIISRPFSGPADLAVMETMVSAAWAGPTRPRVAWTVGDIEWFITGAGPGADLSTRIQLWLLDD